MNLTGPQSDRDRLLSGRWDGNRQALGSEGDPVSSVCDPHLTSNYSFGSLFSFFIPRSIMMESLQDFVTIMKLFAVN